MGGAPYGLCSPGHVCLPDAVDGFEVCVEGLQTANMEDAAVGCPPDFPVLHLLYSGLTDTRQCGACSCGAPVGSKCSTSVSVYTDDMCGASDPAAPALLTLGVDSASASCGDIKPIGSALGSKKATQAEYQPGSCSPMGGELSGAVTPTIDSNARRVCCQSFKVIH
jgi:hypothetical protein